uniref:Cytochrome b5 heme-binding domain-containing protein n=1 Tax=Mycena chlorophos TaxID=658473 RepID=A0ABQ0MBE2_MYCCL|nr:predicted protein [Mycena chlorophos]
MSTLLTTLQSIWSVGKYSLVIILPVLFLLSRSQIRSSTRDAMIQHAAEQAADNAKNGGDGEKTTIMQPARMDLLPPLDKRFTLAELALYDGKEGRPTFLSIKGTVFDVSRNTAVYGPEGSYHVFTGKDASRGLGMSSLKDIDAVPEFGDLDEKDRKVLDDWHLFFVKRYNIVGKVIDHPTLLAEERKKAEEEAAAAAEAEGETTTSS